MSATCKSCGEAIMWAVTEKGHRIPLNPEPAPHGNVVVSEWGVAHIVSSDPAGAQGSLDAVPDTPRYVSHFATCGSAARHRRRKPKNRSDRYAP